MKPLPSQMGQGRGWGGGGLHRLPGTKFHFLMWRFHWEINREPNRLTKVEGSKRMLADTGVNGKRLCGSGASRLHAHSPACPAVEGRGGKSLATQVRGARAAEPSGPVPSCAPAMRCSVLRHAWLSQSCGSGPRAVGEGGGSSMSSRSGHTSPRVLCEAGLSWTLAVPPATPPPSLPCFTRN